MRKIRAKKQKKVVQDHTSNFLNTKDKVIKASIIVAVVLVIIAVIIAIESGDGKFTVKNKTDLKIEYINAYFVDTDGQLSSPYTFENIEADKSVSKLTMYHDLLAMNANLEVYVKFENYDEFKLDAGIFNDIFQGNINLSFLPIDEKNVTVKVTAKTGVLSNRLIECNESYEVDLENAFVSE